MDVAEQGSQPQWWPAQSRWNEARGKCIAGAMSVVAGVTEEAWSFGIAGAIGSRRSRDGVWSQIWIFGDEGGGCRARGGMLRGWRCV